VKHATWTTKPNGMAKSDARSCNRTEMPSALRHRVPAAAIAAGSAFGYGTTGICVSDGTAVRPLGLGSSPG